MNCFEEKKLVRGVHDDVKNSIRGSLKLVIFINKFLDNFLGGPVLYPIRYLTTLCINRLVTLQIITKIPGDGWAGRFWPKINCEESGDECEFGQSSPPCPAQGCQPPADTKVEFYFPSQPPTEDSWYDISLVDGYSLPMRIVPRGVEQVLNWLSLIG